MAQIALDLIVLDWLWGAPPRIISELHIGSEQVSQKQLYWSPGVESWQSHDPYKDEIGSCQHPWGKERLVR